MTTDTVRTLVEDLERHLGDPYDPAAAVRAARVLELDEAQEYPHEILEQLMRLGAHEYAIPLTWGGRARDLETALHMVRLVARRDPTTATALSIASLSYMPIWVAGSEEQRTHYARMLCNGAKMSWGLSEREHGSDLLANEMRATKVPGGYLVDGEKWLIGNATLADYVVLFVRTGTVGPAAFSLMVVDKRDVPRSQLHHLPGEALHGLRGIDMSGVRLDQCFIPDSAVIGGEGRGLEVALKASHAVRTMITSLSLGSADTALRLTLDFAVERRIFDSRVVDIPYSRRQLVDSYADLLIADAVAAVAARSLQVMPGQSSVHSSVGKYYIPTLLQAAIGQLAVVLGARHYLRHDPRFGLFQKMLRDAPVADFADGNTVVNLKNLVAQMPALTSYDGAADTDRLAMLFDLDAEMPLYEPWRHDLTSRGADDAVTSIRHSVDILAARGAEDLAAAGEEILTHVARVGERWREIHELHGRRATARPEAMDAVKDWCVLHAAGSVLGLWAHSQELVPPVEVGAWCLRRLLHRLGSSWQPAVPDAVEEVTVRHMLGRHERGEAFSLMTLRLAASPITPPAEVNSGSPRADERRRTVVA